MSETEKKSKSNNQNAKFIQDIKRGDKKNRKYIAFNRIKRIRII